MRVLMLSVVASCLVLAPPVAAQSVAGDWDAALHTPGGIRTVRMVFQVQGDTLTGTVKRPTGDVALRGTVKGNAVKFSYLIEYNGNPLLVTITATLTGDSMQGKVDFEGMAEDEFSAKRVSGPQAVPATAVRPGDAESLQAILAALYDVISGPAGQRRDWDRMRALFAPGARLIPAVYRPDSVPSLRVWDLEQYISMAGPRLEASGFFEREIAHRTERFGGVVHVFSTYESRRALADPAPFARGINSIQLFFDGRRWWIVTIYWEGERPGNPIPAAYLKSPGG